MKEIKFSSFSIRISFINFVIDRNEAEKEFVECSEVAKKEIKAFHQRRLSEFRQALLYYVEVNNEQLPNLTKFLNSANQKLLYIH